MPKPIILISLISLIAIYACSTVFAQDKAADPSGVKIIAGSNILFDVESESNEYVASDIEHDLVDLNIAGRPNTKLFHTVVGLNFLLYGYSENEKIVIKGELFDKKSHSDDKLLPSKQLEATYNSVLEQIKKVQYFLQVKVNPLNNGTLGVWFTLYETFDSGTFNFQNLNPLRHRTISFNIDSKKEDYQSIIRMNLHRLIYEANGRPIPHIMYNDNPIRDSIRVEFGDLMLEGKADAPYAPFDSLKWHWEITCEACPENNLTILTQIAGFNVEKFHRYHLKLTVSDGHSADSTTCMVIVVERPQLDLYLQLGNDFSKSKIRLYTYHKQFIPNDDFDFFKIFIPIKKRNVIDKDRNWIDLTDNIQVVSTLPNLKFTVAQYNSVDIPNPTNETEVPIIGKSDFIQVPVPSLMFIMRNDSTKSYGDSVFYNRFSLFGKSDVLGDIPASSTMHFILNGYDNNNTVNYNFDVDFRKKSRISQFFNFSGITLNGDNGNSIYLVGIGVDYLIIKGVSTEGSIGSATTKSFSSPVKPYYKVDLDFNVLNFENAIHLGVDFSNLYRETYFYPPANATQPITAGGYRFRFGFGGFVRLFPSDAKYFPFSFDEFYNFYPVGYNVFNFHEFGLRACFYFAK